MPGSPPRQHGSSLRENDAKIRYGVLALPNFPMMAFSALIEPLRAANELGATPGYEWRTVAADGHALRASCGMTIAADHSAKEGPPVDRLVVCSGGDADQFTSDAALGWMRREARRGAMLGAVADGAFFLARGGFLAERACTLHWTSQAAFSEEFPTIPVKTDLYVIDRDRFTAAGGVGVLDMMLEVIEGDYGRTIAAGVAEWFVHSRVRRAADRELLSLRLRTGVGDDRVLGAIAAMEANIEDPLSIEVIARAILVSPDTLERAFLRETELSPIRYYRLIRLRRARDLLKHSSLKISEVALASGFADPSSFARAYRELFHRAPREERQPVR